ncbi:sigma-70 family RNA polymerase sigma factor [bacterium]|nr:sigma-70 family RNA polymerase sigma factor [bacterium]
MTRRLPSSTPLVCCGFFRRDIGVPVERTKSVGIWFEISLSGRRANGWLSRIIEEPGRIFENDRDRGLASTLFQVKVFSSMSESDQRFESLLLQARSGDDQALGALLDEFRPYLRLLAKRAMDGRLAGRIDDSDVVQQTFLSAVRRFSEFTDNSTEAMAAWLRRIHERNLIDTARKHVESQRRSVTSEVTNVAVEPIAEEELTSPSQRLMRGEDAVCLARAISRLPEDQAEAIRLRHLDAWAIDQIAERMNRTRRAVIALLHRGITNLRQTLSDE